MKNYSSIEAADDFLDSKEGPLFADSSLSPDMMLRDCY
jgi:hypothetical protein